MVIEINNPIFGNNLRFLRGKYHLSQTGLAGLVGINVFTLRQMEEHWYPTRMTAFTLYRLQDVLNVSIEDLTGTELEKLDTVPYLRTEDINCRGDH